MLEEGVILEVNKQQSLLPLCHILFRNCKDEVKQEAFEAEMWKGIVRAYVSRFWVHMIPIHLICIS